MTNRDAQAVFDGQAFLQAVYDYLGRSNISRRQLLTDAGLDIASGLQVLRGDRMPSLLVACALADVCDLSLDTYRRTR
jgi:transcriptional regulator with XRE-family HTH domain